jgi:hypothetical protein
METRGEGESTLDAVRDSMAETIADPGTSRVATGVSRRTRSGRLGRG